ASSSSSGQAAAAGTSGTAPDIVLGADAVSYPVDDSGRIDYAAVSGSSVSQNAGKGYISITPSLPDPLYTETQSGLSATWTAYDVTLTLDGTPIVVPTIRKGDSTAVVIENVPTGARVEAQATITVESTSAAAGLGYTTLSAAASATIQEGSNTITMYAQYPLSC
ncbi:MAG TPA: hypothetical protein DDW78_08905, partial [Treponema sp.]|nr:hypothetical protein [Treponema sp.]